MIKVEGPNAGQTIEFQDDIQELTIARLNKFELHLLQDAGMGSTLTDLDLRFQNLDAFLSAGKLAEAMRERENSNFGLFMLFSGISTKGRALADLVHSIDGVVQTDFSDSACILISGVIAERVTFANAEEIAESVKKKLMPN